MVQKKLPLINSAHGSETRNIINELIRLFNNMGYTYDEALNKAHDILDEAQQTNDMNESVQQQINTLIAESGTSDSEVLQARIDAEGNEYPVLKERLDENDAQLAEKATYDELNENTLSLQKILNEDKKQKSNPKLYTDSFDSNLNNWNTTTGFVIDVNGELTVDATANEPPHTNIALFDTVDEAKSIEVTLGINPTKFRLAFGKDTENFVFVSGATDQFNVYRVIGGKLITSFNFVELTPNHTFVTGDKVKISLFNQVLQFYINGDLVATMDNPTGGYILPEGKIKAGVAARDYANAWGASEVKVHSKPPKYMHFSVDDVHSILKDLHDNRGTYTSIFDNFKMNFFKTMYDKYGATCSLYCFYTDGIFDLSQMTGDYSSEFKENAHWLKIGFHAYDSTSNYGDGSITPAEALIHYNDMMTQIRRFAHAYNIDNVVRLGFYGGTLDVCRAFRDAETQMKGFLTADDNRVSDYYLNDEQRKTMKYCDDYFDQNERLYFVRTDIRIDGVATGGMTPLLDSRLSENNYLGQNGIIEIFTHENYIGGTPTRNNWESACKWAIDKGYVFDFPMNNIPKY